MGGNRALYRSAHDTTKLRGLLTAEYQLNAVTATVIYHGTGPGVYANGFIDCTTNCPASTFHNPTSGTIISAASSTST